MEDVVSMSITFMNGDSHVHIFRLSAASTMTKLELLDYYLSTNPMTSDNDLVQRENIQRYTIKVNSIPKAN